MVRDFSVRFDSIYFHISAKSFQTLCVCVHVRVYSPPRNSRGTRKPPFASVRCYKLGVALEKSRHTRVSAVILSVTAVVGAATTKSGSAMHHTLATIAA